eukprot:2978538-Pleurochrysis_carterae.AAC.1
MSAEELSPVEEVKKALDGGALVIDIRAADSSDAFKGCAYPSSCCYAHPSKVCTLDLATSEEHTYSNILHMNTSEHLIRTAFDQACSANKTMPLSAFPEDKTATIVLHCNSGRRVNAAVPFLKEKGYINLLNAGGPAESE